LFAAASMSQNAPVQQQAASISVAEVMDGASLSGVLVKKLRKKNCLLFLTLILRFMDVGRGWLWANINLF